MAVFTVPPAAIAANALATSPGVTAPAFSSARVQLTDPGGQWPAAVDDTRHILKWGFQQSADGGATWDWGPVIQEEPAPGLPFGSRDRSGGLPALALEATQVVAGRRLRLGILTDADVTLGASITVV